MRALLPFLLLACVAAPACSQTPVVVPLRSMERPRDVDFICLERLSNGTWRGVSLEMCRLKDDENPEHSGNYRLHSVVTQQSRGELAVVDIGRVRGDPATLVKVDPRIPGYSFIPVGAAPTDVVADPMGKLVFVSSGRDPRIDVLPSGLLRGPIDTTASTDPPPWPHIDFDRATEGMPSAMSIQREGDTRRLFVTLPDAQPSAKIAVFDLGGKDAVVPVPARVGDILLGAPDAAPLPLQPLRCGPLAGAFEAGYLDTKFGVDGEMGTRKVPKREPWWTEYDRCKGEPPKPIGTPVTVDPTQTDYHLAGVALAGGKLFVADDHVPVIHVYEVSGGRGIEIRKIPTGAPTARLAVSPVVPDEVNIENSSAIDVCTARGWIGDGRDHSAESKSVKEQLSGRCRAHRYIYAVDLINDDAGGGSIAVIDLPVTFAAEGQERLDLDAAELVQPMACDSPTLPSRRLPLGPFAIGGINSVPARTVAFVQLDPPIRNINVKAARCRGWAPDKHPRGNLDLSPADGVPAAERDARIAAGEAWREGVDPKRLRGVFAWVALSNGALVVVDIDDYDATCRGPTENERRNKSVPKGLLAHPDIDPTKEYTLTNALAEWMPYSVRRHHPRGLRAMNANVVPVVTQPSLSRFGNVLSNDPQAETGKNSPHFAGLETQAASDPRPITILPSPDNPYALSTETWTVTYEGQLPGFNGAFGALLEEGGRIVLRDPAGGFCRKGVESDGAAVETHDAVQILDEVCTFNRCTPAEKQSCLDTFGDITVTTQAAFKSRSLLIEKAFDDRLLIANKRFRASGPDAFTIEDGAPDLNAFRKCFGDNVGGTRVLPLLKYAIRGSGSWIVIGGTNGFLHRKIVDPASPEKACKEDLSRPRIMTGRTGQLPALEGDSKVPPYTVETNVVRGTCALFVNPNWKFAIRAGRAASLQDMRFTFTGRFSWQPLSIGAGSLSASIRPIASVWDGREQLNWRMIAVVDAIDRGLLVFPTDLPFAFQKGVN